MTVHGAKGLEATIVILADTTTPPAGPRDPRLLTLPNGALVWATARSGRRRRHGAMRARRRSRTRATNTGGCLYVAMTRAAERLVVCGTQGRATRFPTAAGINWSRTRCSADCVSEPADDGDGEVLRYRKGAAPEHEPQKRDSMRPRPSRRRCRPGSRTNAPPKLRRCAPSRRRASMDDDAARPLPAAGTRSGAAARHAGAPADAVAAGYPRRAPRQGGGRLSRARRRQDWRPRSAQQLAEQVMLVLEDPRFAALFAPGSRAEVPIVGRLILGGETVRVSGQVDRLAVTQDVCPDRRLQDQPPGAAPNRGRAGRLTCSSSRSTAPCSQSSTRTSPCAPL